MIAPLPARTAYFTPNGDAEPGSGLGTLTAWCPHCERLHHHGAAGRGAAARTERRVLDLGLFWRLQDKDRDAQGRGLLDLAAALYGISPGIAARRIIETVAGVSIPPDTALEVEAAIDRWADPPEGL